MVSGGGEADEILFNGAAERERAGLKYGRERAAAGGCAVPCAATGRAHTRTQQELAAGHAESSACEIGIRRSAMDMDGGWRVGRAGSRRWGLVAGRGVTLGCSLHHAARRLHLGAGRSGGATWAAGRACERGQHSAHTQGLRAWWQDASPGARRGWTRGGRGGAVQRGEAHLHPFAAPLHVQPGENAAARFVPPLHAARGVPACRIHCDKSAKVPPCAMRSAGGVGAAPGAGRSRALLGQAARLHPQDHPEAEVDGAAAAISCTRLLLLSWLAEIAAALGRAGSAQRAARSAQQPALAATPSPHQTRPTKVY